MRMLAAREHGRYDLKQKLALRDYPPHLVEQVLSQLEQDGLLSEKRFVEQFIHSRKNKGYGPVRIRNELRQRQIDADLMDAFLDDYDPCWREIMLDVHDRKYGSDRQVDFREMSRRARFLQYRGFSAELVRQFFGSN